MISVITTINYKPIEEIIWQALQMWLEVQHEKEEYGTKIRLCKIVTQKNKEKGSILIWLHRLVRTSKFATTNSKYLWKHKERFEKHQWKSLECYLNWETKSISSHYKIYNYPINSYWKKFFSSNAWILSQWVQMEPKRDILYQKKKCWRILQPCVARTFANLDIDNKIIEHQEQRNQRKSKLTTRLN